MPTEDPWPPRRRVHSLDDLPAALGLESLDDLGDWIEARLPDIGDLWFDWDNANDDGVCIPHSMLGTLTFAFDLPATRRQFEAALAALRDVVEARLRIVELFARLDDLGEAADPGPLATMCLAGFLQVDPLTLLSTVGGGWRPVDGSRLTGQGGYPLIWLGAGEPLQVLLGIGDEAITVASPIDYPGGLAGPPWLEGENPVDIELGTPDTLDALHEAIQSALSEARREWDFCDACRRLRPLMSNGPARICRGCAYPYAGVIVD